MEHSVHHVVFLVIMSGCMAANRDCTEENVDVTQIKIYRLYTLSQHRQFRDKSPEWIDRLLLFNIFVFQLCMEPMKKFELDKYTAIVPVFDEASLNTMCK